MVMSAAHVTGSQNGEVVTRTMAKPVTAVDIAIDVGQAGRGNRDGKDILGGGSST
jgi:hypothetical protein